MQTDAKTKPNNEKAKTASILGCGFDGKEVMACSQKDRADRMMMSFPTAQFSNL
ncbi:MAG: hypothetical protein M5U34_34450 [Chloroflexi bacterium]|nr:hypothetical protein [Chloroflexota bacterium]